MIVITFVQICKLNNVLSFCESTVALLLLTAGT